MIIKVEELEAAASYAKNERDKEAVVMAATEMRYVALTCVCVYYCVYRCEASAHSVALL